MTKRAVVVGINDYTGIDPTGNNNLSCCVADASSSTDLLQQAFGFDASDDYGVSQVLLRPRRIVRHLRISGVLLQLFDLLGDIAATLGVKVNGESQTTEYGQDRDSRCSCQCKSPP